MYSFKLSFNFQSNISAFILSICILCFSGDVFSQQNSGTYVSTVKLANVEAGNKVIATYEQVLSNPQLLCTEPGCEVIGFAISFGPKGKYYGPYETIGSKINKKQIELLEQFRKENIVAVKVYIENIKTKNGHGKQQTRSPIIFTIIGH